MTTRGRRRSDVLESVEETESETSDSEPTASEQTDGSTDDTEEQE